MMRLFLFALTVLQSMNESVRAVIGQVAYRLIPRRRTHSVIWIVLALLLGQVSNASASQIIVADTHTTVIRVGDQCKNVMAIDVYFNPNALMNLQVMRRLARVAHAAISFDCPDYQQLNVVARMKRSRDAVQGVIYRGKMRRRNAWQLVDETISAALSNHTPSRVARSTGAQEFVLSYLNLGLSIDTTRATLRDRSSSLLRYSQRYRLLTAGTDDCIAEHRSRRSAITAIGERCVHARFNRHADPTLDRVTLTEVVANDQVHAVIDELLDRFGSASNRQVLRPDRRFVGSGFGNVVELTWQGAATIDDSHVERSSRTTHRQLSRQLNRYRAEGQGSTSVAGQTLIAQVSASRHATRIVLTLFWSDSVANATYVVAK